MFNFLKKIIRAKEYSSDFSPSVPISYASSIVYSMFENSDAAKILSGKKAALSADRMDFYNEAVYILSGTVWANAEDIDDTANLFDSAIRLTFEMAFFTGICAAYIWDGSPKMNSMQSLLVSLSDFDDGFDHIADAAYLILRVHPDTTAEDQLSQHIYSIAKLAVRPLSDEFDTRAYHAQLMECSKAMIHYGVLYARHCLQPVDSIHYQKADTF